MIQNFKFSLIAVVKYYTTQDISLKIAQKFILKGQMFHVALIALRCLKGEFKKCNLLIFDKISVTTFRLPKTNFTFNSTQKRYTQIFVLYIYLHEDVLNYRREFFFTISCHYQAEFCSKELLHFFLYQGQSLCFQLRQTSCDVGCSKFYPFLW